MLHCEVPTFNIREKFGSRLLCVKTPQKYVALFYKKKHNFFQIRNAKHPMALVQSWSRVTLQSVKTMLASVSSVSDWFIMKTRLCNILHYYIPRKLFHSNCTGENIQ